MIFNFGPGGVKPQDLTHETTRLHATSFPAPEKLTHHALIDNSCSQVSTSPNTPTLCMTCLPERLQV